MRLAVAVTVALTLAGDTLTAQVAPRPFLFKDARGELAAAAARGEDDVLLVIAAMPGANGVVAERIAAVGGTVRYRADDVDYLSARVPLDRVEKLLRDPDVHSLEVSLGGGRRVFARTPDVPFDRGGPPHTAVRDTTPPLSRPAWPPVPSDHLLTSRYDPLADLGAAAFRAANPGFDGRGVTLALIDGHADPLLPELQVARSLAGEAVPKIVLMETSIDPDEEKDGRWVTMADTVRAVDGAIHHSGRTFAAPRPGTFRLGMLDERDYPGVGRDLNRDGNPPGSSRLFSVLWDPETDEVWVDTRQTDSFADETVLTDAAYPLVIGVFGTNDPSTAVRESVGFAVQIDRTRNRIAINAGVGGHGTNVIGVAVASRGTEGLFDGVAPGARLAGISPGSSAYGLIEAVIRAVRNPMVDIVILQQNSSITRNYLPRDGRLVPTVIFARLIAKYGKPIVVPTHNYPVMSGTDDLVLAPGAIGVGGHQSRDSYFANYGIRVEHQDNLIVATGFGPMGNGALKPDVVAPSHYVSVRRGFDDARGMAGLYLLPPGYGVSGGTSTAAPTAAAAVALLMSAARQEGIAYDPFRLEYALTRSARYLSHVPAYQQGNGLVDVARAWEILKALDSGGMPVEIRNRAPVRHSYSHLLPTPHEGVGLFERDGWSVGDRNKREVTFTRTSGSSGPMTFSLHWSGNDDGTFSAPPSVTLPLNTDVPVTIEISPASAGVHSAHLSLEHPEVPGHAYRMLVAIVAPEDLTADSAFTLERVVEIPRPGIRSLFFRVSPGTGVLRIDLDSPDREIGLWVSRPDTRAVMMRPGLFAQTGPSTHVVHDPMPGIWEIKVDDVQDLFVFDPEQALDPDILPRTRAKVRVSALGVAAAGRSVASRPGSGDSSGGGGAVEVSITSRQAAFTGGAVTFPMGSARRERPEIRQDERHVFTVDVPRGSPLLVARATGFSAAGADLDLYVFDCTASDNDEDCRGARADADPLGNQGVLVHHPSPGRWKIVVDGSSVPSAGIRYDYLDVVFSPAFGVVSVNDVPATREPGATWEVRANVWMAGDVGCGRKPWAPLVVEGRSLERGPAHELLADGRFTRPETFLLTVEELP
jgi:hypothetical protein